MGLNVKLLAEKKIQMKPFSFFYPVGKTGLHREMYDKNKLNKKIKLHTSTRCRLSVLMCANEIAQFHSN